MFQLVRKYEVILDTAGVTYQPRAYGEIQLDGSWDGWLVFFPIPVGVAIATDRETIQDSYVNLVHWSATITPIYLLGALERALRIQLGPAFSARIAELADLDEDVDLEMEAARARTAADDAAREAAAHETAAAAARAEAREQMAEAHAIERDLAGVGDRISSDVATNRQRRTRGR